MMPITLPTGFKFDLDDNIIVDGDYYKVIEIDEFEYDTGWLIKTHRVAGADPKVILDVSADNAVALLQSAETL